MSFWPIKLLLIGFSPSKPHKAKGIIPIDFFSSSLPWCNSKHVELYRAMPKTQLNLNQEKMELPTRLRIRCVMVSTTFYMQHRSTMVICIWRWESSLGPRTTQTNLPLRVQGSPYCIPREKEIYFVDLAECQSDSEKGRALRFYYYYLSMSLALQLH